MCADRLTVVMIHLERVSDQQCECIFFFGTYKKHGKFQPASVAKSVASRTGVSCAVRGEGGSGCRRDCWLAVSDWLVDERPGNRIAVGVEGRTGPAPGPGPTQPRVSMGTGSSSCG